MEKIPPTLTENEVEILLRQPEIRNKQGIRDKANFRDALCYRYACIRSSKFKINNVNLDIGFLRCVGSPTAHREAETAKAHRG